MARTHNSRRSRIEASRKFSLSDLARASTTPVGLSVGLVVLCFLFGGGSRADILSLMWLRPAAVLLLGAGLLTLRREHLSRYPALFALLGAVWALAVLHLLPLPPSLWQALPGRDIIVRIDDLAGIENVWRPLSMHPEGSWNALWALVIPTAALVLAAQLDARAQRTLLLVVLILGAISITLAAAQFAGGTSSGAYFYRITNRGAPPGLFANRNHQAVFLASLFPLLAAWWRISRSEQRDHPPRSFDRQTVIALAAGLAVVPLILVTGSRAGLVASLVGFFGVLWITGLPAKPTPVKRSSKSKFSQVSRYAPMAIIGLGVVLLATVTVTLGRGTAFDRLFGDAISGDMRADITPIVWGLAQDYGPWGSGIGSIVPVFRMHEPEAMLAPAYLNHVHNDYLEIALTAGIPGVLLVAAAIVAVGLAAYRLVRRRQESSRASQGGERSLAKAGLTIIVIMLIASAADYPLRTPALSCLLMFACVWLWRGGSRETSATHISRSGD